MNNKLKLALIGTILTGGFAQAQLIGTPTVTYTDSASAFTVSSTDLIEGFYPDFTAGTEPSYYQGQFDGGNYPYVLTDGSFGANQQGAGSGNSTLFPGDVLNYEVDPSTPILSIATYSGGDPYRGEQNYTLSYSLDDGATYTDLATVTTPGFSYNTRAVIDGFTLVNVTDLKFTFAGDPNLGAGNDYDRYREIDVFGPSVVVPPVDAPEPSTYALVGVGFLGLFLARRRMMGQQS